MNLIKKPRKSIVLIFVILLTIWIVVTPVWRILVYTWYCPLVGMKSGFIKDGSGRLDCYESRLYIRTSDDFDRDKPLLPGRD